MCLTFTTTIPPSVNSLYATVKGRRVLSKAGREYKDSVGRQIMAENGAQRFTVASGDRLALTIRLYFPDKRRTDISNRIKVLEDALSEVLHFDDCCVDRLLVERAGIDKQDPRCIVELETI